MLTIKTNNKPRLLLWGYELTEKEKAEFDYIPADEIDGKEFFRYKGDVYDVSEFMSTNGMEPLKEWDGYSSDSAFSGVVIRVLDDAVICGTYFS